MVLLQNLDSWDPDEDLHSRACNDQRLYAIAFGKIAPKKRNLFITRTYADMAAALEKVLGTQCPNWCTYGSWASDAVGVQLISSRIPIVDKVLTRAFAYGNRSVFLNVGTAVTTFLDAFGSRDILQNGTGVISLNPTDPARRWAGFVQFLGLPIAAPPSSAGAHECKPPEQSFEPIQDEDLLNHVDPSNYLLALAMHSYYKATQAEGCEKRRLVVQGNRFLVHHEQRLVHDAVIAGFRLPVRTRFRGPFRSYRDWRIRQPNACVSRLEDAAVWVGMRMAKVKIGEMESVRLTKPPGKPSADDAADGYWAKLHENEFGSRAKKDWTSLAYRVAFTTRLFGIGNRPENESTLAPRLAKEWSIDDRINESSPKNFRQLSDRAPEPRRTAHLKYMVDQLMLHGDGRPIASRRIAVNHVTTETRNRLVVDLKGLFTEADLQAAAMVFHKWQWIILSLLFVRSLPDDYAGADGVTLLGLKSGLQNDPVARTGQTTEFLLDLFGRNGEDPQWWGERRDGKGVDALTSLAGLRQMHYQVRLHAEGKPWPAPADSKWLNLEDTLGSAFSFCVTVIEAIEEFAKEGALGEEWKAERDAYVKAWMAVAVVLGVPVESVCCDGKLLSYTDAKKAADALRASQRRRNMVGTRLMESMILGFRDGLPRPLAPLAEDVFLALGESAAPPGCLLTANEALCVGTLRSTERASPFRLWAHDRAQGVIRIMACTGVSATAKGGRPRSWLARRAGRFVEKSVTKNDFGRPYRDMTKVSEVKPRRPAADRATPPSELARSAHPSLGELKLDGYADWERNIIELWLCDNAKGVTPTA